MNTRLTAVAAILAFSIAQPVLAAGKARAFLGYYQDLIGAVGGSMTSAAETETDDTITLNDLTFTFDLPEDGSFDMELIGWMALRETADGRVAMTLSDEMAMTIVAEPPGEDEVRIEGSLSSSAFEMLIAQDADGLEIDFAADQQKIAITSITVDGETVPVGIDLALDGVSGRQSLAGSMVEGMDFDFALGVAKLVAHANVREPDGDGFFTLSHESSGHTLEESGHFQFPEELEAAIDEGWNPLAEGLFVDFLWSFGAGKTAMAFQDRSDNFSLDATVGGGEAAFALSRDIYEIGYQVSDGSYSITSSEMPLPRLDVAMGALEFLISVPLGAIEEPGEYAFVTALRDFTVSDMLWAIFDPSGQLDHGPATVAVAVGGKMKMLADISDTAALMQIDEDAPPVEIETLDVTELTLRAGGAELVGTGNFAFDNSSKDMLDAIGQPSGILSLSLKGGFKVLDTLQAMGLVPDDAALGIRAMIGAFARPGDGPDHLVSEIEITPDFQILANGQRLPFP